MLSVAKTNEDIIRKLWGELHGSGSKASLEMMTGFMDENIDWEVVPLGLKRHGIAEVKLLIQSSWNDMPEGGHHEITNVFANDEWVCLEYTAHGKITKELKHLNLNHPVEGQVIEVRSIDVFHIKNGKIDLAREYYDHATLLRQLGVKTLEDMPMQ